MSEREPLHSPDSWVQLRDPKTLRSGDKRAVLRQMQDFKERPGAATLTILDAITIIMVEGWSFQLPLPKIAIESLDLLEIEDYDRIIDLVTPAQERLFPTPPAATPEQQADEASPTVPSGA